MLGAGRGRFRGISGQRGEEWVDLGNGAASYPLFPSLAISLLRLLPTTSLMSVQRVSWPMSWLAGLFVAPPPPLEAALALSAWLHHSPWWGSDWALWVTSSCVLRKHSDFPTKCECLELSPASVFLSK